MGGRQAVMASFMASVAFLTYLWSIIVAPLAAEYWPADRVLRSVVRIEVDFNGKAGSCTAFSIDEGQCRYLTAKHCTVGKVTIGFLPLDVIDADDAADLALLQGRHLCMPALALGGQPKAGDATIAIGYPLSSPKPLLVPSMYQGHFDAFNQGNNVATFSGNSIPGMSGGPIVNHRGDVISVVLGGGNPSQVYQNVGFGVPYVSLRRMLLKWREN
jgi:S1-C subfamily serine protease